MSDARKPLGALGEGLVVEHLRAAGWQIVARNWQTRRGEIDIVACEGEWLVFVEVRTRRAALRGGDPYLGRPEDTVNGAKQRQLARAAEAYLFARPWRGRWRIDVIALEVAADDTVARLAHYRDAVGGA